MTTAEASPEEVYDFLVMLKEKVDGLGTKVEECLANQIASSAQFGEGEEGGLNIFFSVLNIVQRPQHRLLAKLWHKNDVFNENKRCVGVLNFAQKQPG